MNPISVGIGRILQTDVILSGYRVPRGVILYFAYIKLNILFKKNIFKRKILFVWRENIFILNVSDCCCHAKPSNLSTS